MTYGECPVFCLQGCLRDRFRDDIHHRPARIWKGREVRIGEGSEWALPWHCEGVSWNHPKKWMSPICQFKRTAKVDNAERQFVFGKVCKDMWLNQRPYLHIMAFQRSSWLQLMQCLYEGIHLERQQQEIIDVANTSSSLRNCKVASCLL